MRFYQLLEDFIKPDGLTNTTGIAIVYHRTKEIDSVNQIKKDGFRPGDSDMYGRGIYTCYDINSQMSEYNKRRYGKFLIKNKVNITGFLNFDSPNINEQLKKLGINEQLEDKEFSSENALYLYGKYPKLTRSVKGIIFTGSNDGKVIVVYRQNLILPISYSKDDGQTWHKIFNKELVNKVLSNRGSMFKSKEEYYDFVRNKKSLTNKVFYSNGKIKSGEISNGNSVKKIEWYENARKHIEEYLMNGKYHREDGPAIIRWHENGQRESILYFINDVRHRTDGPAIIRWHENGVKEFEGYYINDKIHREDGPAITEWYENGQKQTEEYLINGKHHRTDGPAIKKWNKSNQLKIEEYFIRGKRHRLDGPAIIKWNENVQKSSEVYYINGKKMTKEQFLSTIKNI